jgi:hypothetical protein
MQHLEGSSTPVLYIGRTVLKGQHPSSGCRVIPCEQTDGRTDMTKLTVTFRNFANAPKNLWNAKQYGQNHLKECEFKYLGNLWVKRDTLRAGGEHLHTSRRTCSNYMKYERLEPAMQHSSKT